MKRIFGKKLSALCLFSLVLLLPSAFPARAGEKPLNAKEILDYVDDLYRGKSSNGRMTMTISTDRWKRTLSIEFWAKGKEKSLLRILAPKKEEGTATLRSGNDMWNYLPKVKRVIKLPSSMMSASWMGSHFTNDDIVKESRFTNDFLFEVSFEGEREGRQVIEINCTPKPDAAVVWGKIIVVVGKDGYTPIKTLYFDESMKPARTMFFSDVGRIGDRNLPRMVSIVPQDKPEEETEIHYEEITFNTELPEDIFSIRNLER